MAQVKLILLADVDNLGLAGEAVTVAAGYARNYLLPRGLAAAATPATLRQLAARKEKIEAQRQKALEDAQARAAELAKVVVEIPMQASNDGLLFGSVTARAISEQLAAQGFAVEARLIRIDEPIRKVGDFVVQAKLHASVLADVAVRVVQA